MKAALVSAAKQGPAACAAGSVIAALILAAAAVYAVNVWSTTKKETSPAKNIEQGIERIKDAAGKAIESRN